MWMRGEGSLPIAAVTVTVLGCVKLGGPGGPPSKPIVDFPSPAALAALGATPVSPPAPDVAETPAEGWDVVPPPAVAPQDDVWKPEGMWEESFAALLPARTGPLRPTRALSCVSRELGRFYLRTNKMPSNELIKFMSAACGQVAPDVGYQTLFGEIPDRVKDQELASWRSDFGPRLLDKVPTTATETGFWFGRGHGRAVAVVAYTDSHLKLARFSPIPDANGDVCLEGEWDKPVDHFSGYANRGAYGVEPCAVDPTVPKPRFRIVCHVASDDATAWIQLLVTPPRRVLETPFAQVLARRTLDQPLPYREATLAGPRPVANKDGLAVAVVEQLNVVRASAGLRPVKLSPQQSATAGRLVGRYFAAALAPDPGDDPDKIALGLLAGWEVGGMIRDGLFFSTLAPNTKDSARWLGSAVATPLGRATLLAPEIEEVAIGPVMLSDPGGLAAVVVGYQFHHDADHAADIKQLHDRLTTARRRLSLEAARPLPGMDKVLHRDLAHVHAGKLQPSSALRSALATGVDHFGAGMRGYIVETTSMDAVEIPPEVVRKPSLRMAIGVTHFKPPGAAWAQLVVLIVFVDEGGLAI
jgi:hypothetical protein